MILISEQQLPSIIKRLSHQILETHPGLENTVIIGLQPRGVYLSSLEKTQVIINSFHNFINENYPNQMLIYLIFLKNLK